MTRVWVEEVYTWDHGNAMNSRKIVTEAWLPGLLECILGHGKVITKLMINQFVNGLYLVDNISSIC